REMRDGSGGFYATQDADVDGEEGVYYLWDYGEVESVIGAAGAQSLASYYSLTRAGNYEGGNMLRMNPNARPPDATVDEGIKGLLAELFEARGRRAAPRTDRKIITAWNGLAITALVEAGSLFERGDLIEAAGRCARFLLESVEDGHGRLLRYHLDGKARVAALLEDYALFADSLLVLNEATGDKAWLDPAQGLITEMIRLFYDPEDRLFYDTGADQRRLFVRERDLYDNDVPSGNSAAADLLLRASRLLGEARYRRLCEEILRTVESMDDEPLSYGNFLCVNESISGDKERR
ncbi:MAG: thioredoxin domain-containing protein, partial [Thermodesulfobacteriota bacterium]